MWRVGEEKVRDRKESGSYQEMRKVRVKNSWRRTPTKRELYRRAWPWRKRITGKENETLRYYGGMGVATPETHQTVQIRLWLCVLRRMS